MFVVSTDFVDLSKYVSLRMQIYECEEGDKNLTDSWETWKHAQIPSFKSLCI